MYLEEELSSYKIGDMYDVNPITIRRILQVAGIKLKKGGWFREKSPRWTGYEEITGSYWSSVVCASRRVGREWNITQKYMWELFLKQDRKCALTGIPLILAKNNKEHCNGVATASIDRIDSNKGYIKGNVQWVHKTINLMKRELPEQEFVNWCKMVTKCKGEDY